MTSELSQFMEWFKIQKKKKKKKKKKKLKNGTWLFQEI